MLYKLLKIKAAEPAREGIIMIFKNPKTHSSYRFNWTGLITAAVLTLTLIACTDENDGNSVSNNNCPVNEGYSEDYCPTYEGPFEEVFEQCAGRYLGVYTPAASDTSGDDVIHSFSAGSGPLCLDGSEYKMSTRDGSSDELIIFLEGGGGCWSTFCMANQTAPEGVSTAGIMNPDSLDSPLAGADVAYFPYCDGSLFAGDVDNDYGCDGVIEYQRGLKNLSAGLDVTQQTFPSPSRIILAGNSGGGFGTIFALPMVRAVYPDTPIYVINDSGLGIAKDGDPSFLETLVDDWHLDSLIPSEGCADCLSSGHLTDYFAWQFTEDDNFSLAMLSSKQDFTIGTVFLGVGGEAFQSSLETQLPLIEIAGNGQMRYWLSDGSDHTFIQRDLAATAGGVSVLDWLTSYLNSDESWISVSD